MDRRRRKTRNAIFEAFIALLDRHSYGQITVGQIIERADVGRATFYAHFETKEELLKALCRELFAHIFEAAEGEETAHSYLFDCQAPDSVFLHLFQHLQKDDNRILTLLSCRNNDLFLGYFKEELRELIKSREAQFSGRKDPRLPDAFWLDHIAATFTETLRWWLENGRKEPPETITEYFYLAV
ncbi:MAG: TetR/AcrR family transcriptional regulator [Oscillospiraceae bacterium]|nr:TetR/AcrR family transcriptional regulator [Oscillospiraceae bacterium]